LSQLRDHEEFKGCTGESNRRLDPCRLPDGFRGHSDADYWKLSTARQTDAIYELDLF
jgi:hypothetical protein